MGFFSTLEARMRQINSMLVVGLDPHQAELPESATTDDIITFCSRIIDATKDVALAYKPNSAFFEAYGPEGLVALKAVVKLIPADTPIILDVKRGDISSTAAAYATAAFTQYEASAVTLAPYMGSDAINPFTSDASKGCFVLCKTSNPSSNEIQTISTGYGETRQLYTQIASLTASKWNVNDNVGLVVGATDTLALSSVRKTVGDDVWILAPGIGAQGGNLEQAIAAGINSRKTGLLLPISRGISKAADPKAAATEFRDAMNAAAALSTTTTNTTNTLAQDFISFALTAGVLKFGSFTLKSGRTSPYFFNAGLFHSGRVLAAVGRYYAKEIYNSKIEFDVIFGPAYKGITLAATIAMAYDELYQIDLPYAYNRKEEKDHGEGGKLVGASIENKRVLIVDDVITAGTAIGEVMNGTLKANNAKAVGVCIALDRQERVSESLEVSAVQGVMDKFGIPVLSIASLKDLVAYLKASDDASALQEIMTYQQTYGI